MSESESTTLHTTDLPLPLLHRGKVRDVYAVGADALLMLASDRVSAFDVVLPQAIPRKGEVLTQVTAWWLKQLEAEGIDHHLIAIDPVQIIAQVPELADTRSVWERRSMLVHRTDPVMVECVIRGYISGSAWKEYKTAGTLAGEPLPKGLVESERLQSPVFSPATKAVEGHDENITFDTVVELEGSDVAHWLRDTSRTIYDFGVRAAEARGIILADTKFEFGRSPDGRMLLIDEVLTPDSSRYWPADQYAPGRGQPSLDKQPIRDYLDGLESWDRTPPGPSLPDEVVAETTRRYLEIFRRLTGVELRDFDPPVFKDLL